MIWALETVDCLCQLACDQILTYSSSAVLRGVVRGRRRVMTEVVAVAVAAESRSAGREPVDRGGTADVDAVGCPQSVRIGSVDPGRSSDFGAGWDEHL